MPVNVGPTVAEPTHYLSLSDGTTTLGIYLANNQGVRNPRAIQRTPVQRTPLKTAQGAEQYTDLELPYISVAQDDWSGGRGWLDFEKDKSKYFDAGGLNPIYPGQLILNGQPTYTEGHRLQVMAQPGKLIWTSLVGATAYLARSFVPGSTFNAAYAWVHLRRAGSPGWFTVELHNDNAGVPGTLIDGATITTSDVTDYLAVHYRITMASQSLTQGSTYWILVKQSTGTPDASNHWEVGTSPNADSTKKSADGSSWSTATNGLYFRTTDAEKPFTALFFNYKGQLYFGTNYDDDSPGKVYMNGYRGVCDSNSGDKTKLNAGASNFASDFVGVAQIIDGRGYTETQPWRNAVYNSPTSLTCTPAWNIPHLATGDGRTQFVAMGGNRWTLQQTGTYPFLDVAVSGEIAWLCSGEDRGGLRPIYKLREYYDGDVWKQYFAGENGQQASYMLAIPHPTFGYQMYLATNRDWDEEVSVVRIPAPRDHQDGLTFARAYRSATSNGFMRERLISPYASDSFNRVDGVPGSTDGAGHTATYPFTTGGSGVAWISHIGTWGIVSNKMKSSALTGGKAMVGLAPSSNNVVVRAKVFRSAGQAGIFTRRLDDSNYIKVFYNTGKVTMVKRVAAVETTVLDITTTYVDGAELEVKCNLTEFTVTYNGAQVGTKQTISDSALQSSNGVGMYTEDIGNTFDNFYVYENPVVVTKTAATGCEIFVPASFATGVIVSDVVGVEDWRRYSRLEIAIRSTVALAAGQLQLLIDDDSLVTSPFVTVNFPQMSANVRYGYRPNYSDEIDIQFDLSAQSGAATVRSIGLNIASDVTTDMTIYLSIRYVRPDNKRIQIGDANDLITGLERYGDPETLWVMKEGGPWQVENDVATAVPLREMGAVKSPNNGRAHLVHDVYLYFSLLNSLERYFRQNVDDVGPNRDAGLPGNRQGNVSYMVGYPGKIFVAIDGGYNNYSSVLCYSGSGIHEVFRAPMPGLRIRRLHIQTIPGEKPDRLWISMGSDVLWLPLPSNNFNPFYDPNYLYLHEGFIETAWIYSRMKDIAKRWKSVKIFSENLSAGNRQIALYYQADNDTAWTKVTTEFTTSPVQEINLNGTTGVNSKRIRFRLVVMTNDNTISPRVMAMVVESLTKVPVRYQYTFSFMVSDGLVQIGELDLDDTSSRAENVMATLDGWMENLTLLTMRTVFSPFDNKTVMLENTAITPISVNTADQIEKHMAQATVIEA